MANYIYDDDTKSWYAGPIKDMAVTLVPGRESTNGARFKLDGQRLQFSANGTTYQDLAGEHFINVSTRGVTMGAGIDNTAALQAILDAAVPGDTIYIPRGILDIFKPVYCYTRGVRILGEGASDEGTYVRNAGQIKGPLVFLGAEPPAFPLATAGGMTGLDCRSNPQWICNLYENDYLNLNTLGAFSFEGIFYLSSLNGNMLAGSSATTHNGSTETWSLVVNGSGGAAFQLNVGGLTIRAEFGAGVTTGLHEFAACFDGSTLKFFYDGVLKNTQTAVGTITQTERQNVFVGANPVTWPDYGGVGANSADMIAMSVRISNIARHSNTYTPGGVKFTSGFGTLGIYNFDTFYGPFMVGNAEGANHFIFRRQSGYSQVVGMGVENLQFGGGLMAQAAINMNIRNLSFLAGTYGLCLRDNCYDSVIENIEVTARASTQFMAGNLWAAGINRWSNLNFSGGGDGLVIGNSSVIVSKAYINGTPGRAGILVNAVSEPTCVIRCDQVFISDENQHVPQEFGLVLMGVNQFAFTDGVIDLGYNDSSPVGFANIGLGKAVFKNSTFLPKSGGTEPLFKHLAGSALNKIRAEDLVVLNSGHARCDAAGHVVYNSDNQTVAATAVHPNAYADVTFAVAQPFNDYDVTGIIPTTSTGTPATGSWRVVGITNKLTTGFRILLEAEPGSGNTQTFAARVTRDG